jgi:hypothetical protein
VLTRSSLLKSEFKGDKGERSERRESKYKTARLPMPDPRYRLGYSTRLRL